MQKCVPTIASEWTRKEEDNSTKFYMYHLSGESGEQLAVDKCLTVNEDRTWTLFVNGREVDKNKCAELRSLPHSLDDESAVFTVLNRVDHLRVCPGHPDKQFIELLHAKKGCIKSADGSTVASIDTCGVKLNGEIYDQTVRVANCEILSQGVKCLECKKYRPTLRAINHRHLKKLASPKRAERNTVVSSKTNFRYLSTPEKTKRFSNMRVEIDTYKRNIEQLKGKVASITKRNGVVVKSINHLHATTNLLTVTNNCNIIN